jgi:hypothetical protein
MSFGFLSIKNSTLTRGPDFKLGHRAGDAVIDAAIGQCSVGR